MAVQPPTKDERDANLEALKKAVDEWAEVEIRRLENETTFLRAVLQGRGASDLGTKNLALASRLLQTEINQFLVATAGETISL